MTEERKRDDKEYSDESKVEVAQQIPLWLLLFVMILTLMGLGSVAYALLKERERHA